MPGITPYKEPAIKTIIFTIVAMLQSMAVLGATAAPAPSGFSPSSTCAGCHQHIYEQHKDSMHEKSYVNPLFQAQLAKEILPRAANGARELEEAKGCIACHAPIRSLTAPLPDIAELKPEGEGVTCDFCHTLTGIGKNGEYLSNPKGKKLGPLNIDNWHSTFSQSISKSSFCAPCHNAFNSHNVEIKATYNEWRRSKYAAKDIQCQDCHMSAKGYLNSSGKAEYAQGKAAYLGSMTNPRPEHAKLYTHRFPGAHDKTQVEAALKVRLGGENSYRPGMPFSVAVFVDNEHTGHNMPTGSTDLRLLWLEVALHTEKGDIPVPAASRVASGYDVAGAAPTDHAFLGKDVPAGARLYRTIFGGPDKKPVFSALDATSILYDNRLKPSERRLEEYAMTLPANLTGPVRLEARLMYLRYPSAMAARLGVSPAQPSILAAAEKSLTPAHALPAK